MTLTYFSLDKSLSTLDSLVIPSEIPDVKANLNYSWTVWLQTESNEEDYKNATKRLVKFHSIEVCFGDNTSFSHSLSGLASPQSLNHLPSCKVGVSLSTIGK